MTPLLAAAGLALSGRLHPTDLEIREPSLVCLVGPNGSGKTSLLHALAGIGAAAGDVLIDGRTASSVAPARRPRLLAYLPASRDVAWPVAARALVELGGADAYEADKVMASLGVADHSDRRVDRLSTGERSRVLIARALAPRPRLLLLDEPTANLDPLWQLRMMDHLRDLTRQGDAAVLVAMHDLDLAGRYADRLLLMDGGRIVADGVPAAILDGAELWRVFGIERTEGVWRPISPPEGRRSSR
jgi:iron complex transport system ATP-binding protein